MFGRIAAYGGAMALAALLLPLQSSAKSLGISPPHTGSIAAHVHHHGQHHHLGSYRNGYWYGYGYGYPYVLLDDASDTGRDRVVPLAYPVYVGPRCMHSVDFVKVPAEFGGERVIRITRC